MAMVLYYHYVSAMIVTMCLIAAQGGARCIDGICEGVEGDEVIIPCGPDDNVDINVTYTYYNYTSKSILLHNSQNYLVINLTAYMDNTQIHCIPDTVAHTIYYTYTLSVMYAPAKLSHVINPILQLHQDYYLSCPLSSNPSPICIWKALNCFNVSISFNMSEYGLVESGCQLYIKEVTVSLKDFVCLQCTAVNELGSGIYTYNSLQISSCPEDAFLTLLPEQGSGPLVIQEGGNLTLVCDGHGFGQFGAVFWCFNSSTTSNTSCVVDSVLDYDQETCCKRSTLELLNINVTNTGTYSCYFENDVISIEVTVSSDSNEVTDQSGATTLSPTVIVCTVLSVVFFTVSMALIGLCVLLQHKCGSILSCKSSSYTYTFTKLNTDEM